VNSIILLIILNKMVFLLRYGYALLYFTGNAHFNRSMRLWARKKGYSLSDHSLVPVLRIKNEKVSSGQNIPCYTEEDVFKAL